MKSLGKDPVAGVGAEGKGISPALSEDATIEAISARGGSPEVGAEVAVMVVALTFFFGRGDQIYVPRVEETGPSLLQDPVQPRGIG